MFRILKNRRLKRIAFVNMLVLVYQLLYPVTAYALTSGPSQPEMQSFEPVGTTDMVDMFTGNFNYNIPLLDVEGYPVNIAYHSGVTMEQEASWVGLGWNINPGNINHLVRGVPDDFKGDLIKKEVAIKAEKEQSFGALLGIEYAGFYKEKNQKKNSETSYFPSGVEDTRPKDGDRKQLSFQANFGLVINNYTGVSGTFGTNGGANAGKSGDSWFSAGVNMGATVSTSDGADFDYSLSAGGGSKHSATGSIGINGMINSHQGLQYRSFGVNPGHADYTNVRFSNTRVPIALQNYIPVITNAAEVKSNFFQVKIGAEINSVYPFWGGSFKMTETNYEGNADKNAYGYFNLGESTDEDIVDFMREKDGRTHRKSKFLPMTNMTYDIYAINGQGTGGNFRGFRNDIGTAHDPLQGGLDSKVASHLLEVGIGSVFEIGFDSKFAYSQAKSGPWNTNKKAFSKKTAGRVYEPYYLKQAGELTETNEPLYTESRGRGPLAYKEASEVMKTYTADLDKRVARGNLLYFLNAEQASLPQVSTQPELANYNFDGFALPGQTPVKEKRIDIAGIKKKHHASEFVQVLPDGRRYIYGLPVMNKKTTDYEFSTAPQVGNPGTVPVTYTGENPNSYDGGDLTQQYYTKTQTPAFAHSYQLSAILSPDYADLTGDGITDDDLGSYTKFNYRKREDYYWRVPYVSTEAQYNKGIKANCNDDKASYSTGIREQWYLHSIETRNFVAEFITSARNDARAYGDPTFGSGVNSYKLDNIVLFNKQDRFTQGANATPIKTVVFNYDYTLCPGIPNSSNGKGKLTLKRIFIKYGQSDIGYLSPYSFDYYGSTMNVHENPVYNQAARDCWGNYKSPTSNSDPSKRLDLNLNNNEFPYVNQNDDDNDVYSCAWNLKQINLPSGGNIKINYEADDYAYVQDKHAMEMFRVEGTGPTPEFITGNSLYHTFSDPHQYIYFERKREKEIGGKTILESYLDDIKLLQYTFDVEISPGKTASCDNTPLVETIKGYAGVETAGICPNDPNHAYIKLVTKTPESEVDLGTLGAGTKLNPITLAAINFCRYYNTRALNPEGEITEVDPPALINQLLSQIASLIYKFENPLKTYMREEKAKTFTINRSFIRLVSQGLKKKGGGHRVKQLQFSDSWAASASSYGSDYDYTMKDPDANRMISSGVASYEPLYGGDENPCKTLLNTEVIGNRSKYPPVDPIELLQEAPLGESLYPPPVVGYSRVTVTSIHKNEGESSQMVQVYEFNTAKDFPVRVSYTNIDKVEDRRPRITDLFNKKDIYRVAQGYTLYLNDMHGKPRKNSVYNDKVGDGKLENMEAVSHTSYEYFQKPDKTLNNTVPCLEFQANGSAPVVVEKTLGEETDISMDSREKEEVVNTISVDFSSNAFLVSVVPFYIPSVFPGFKKTTNTFSSLVNTKVVQQYGIVKTVEDFKKGATIRVENKAFDPKTGQVLVTQVNTERGDSEYSVKYPAYWAYRCMGPAYENIQFEEDIPTSTIVNHKLYVPTNNIDKYNLGDEVLLTGTKFCSDVNNPNAPSNNAAFKLWVVDKAVPPSMPEDYNCDPNCVLNSSSPLLYTYKAGSRSHCLNLDQLKLQLDRLTGNSAFLNIQRPIERVDIHIENNFLDISTNLGHGRNPCRALDNSASHREYGWYSYKAQMHSSYVNATKPYYSPCVKTVRIKIYVHRYASTYSNICNDLSQSQADRRQYCGYVDITYPANSINDPLLFTPPSPFISAVSCDEVTPKPNLGFCPSRIVHTLTRHESYYEEKNEWRKENNTRYLVLSPYKKDATSLNSSFVWPQDEKITEGNMTVIRSGKRNQLTETVQDISTLKNPLSSGSLPNNYEQVINAVSRKYTELASVPDNIPAVYNNPYVTGQKGNYRVLAEYLVHRDRDYNGLANISDAYKGLYGVGSFWSFFNNSNEEFYGRMLPAVNSNSWNIRNNVTNYSPWAVDLEVEDAIKNRHANIVGYDNRTVVATASNAAYNDVLYENFEDYRQMPSVFTIPPVYFYQNTLRRDLRIQMNSSLVGSNVQIVNNAAHSGTQALQFNTATNLNVTIGGTDVAGQLKSFYFRQGKKYQVSFWQKVSAATAPGTSSFRLSGGGVNCIPAARTPVIDGWALYEGEFTIPPAASGQLQFSALTGNLVIDDLRVMPARSNMKCYVYHPVNKRLMAILDENHLATFMEYSDEGKLIRVKKETEKGILTIKESRESLKNRFMEGSIIVQPPFPSN